MTLRWGLVLLVGYGVVQFAYTRWMVHRSMTLTAVAGGQRTLGSGPEFRFFVAGDSLGAGLGASSFETSIAGRIAGTLAAKHRVDFVNASSRGARMPDLLIQALPDERQGLVLLVAGSNDLVHFTPPASLHEQTLAVLARYAPKADRLVLLGPGVVHQAGAIPWIARPIFYFRRPAYVEALRTACAEQGALYVDPAAVTPAFNANFGNTVSQVDHFHLNDEGHRWWAQRVLDETGI